MKPQPRYQAGERIGGRYLVHKALLGGMGEVYLCLDLEGMYPLALKTFQQRYVTDALRLRQAFEQEVATWVALEKHPNIVRCFYMEMLDNQPFMMLEWVAGEEGRGTDLRGWLRRGPLELKLALEIVIDICNGLIHAQTKQPGLVHRDLKPENILMAQGGLAKITDFGLAQIVQAVGLEVVQENAADSRQSFVGGRIAGTPAYMAPEQWRGEALDERTDIYALGCILHELLTGTPPFAVNFTPTTPQQMHHWLAAMQAAHESALYRQRSDGFAPALQDLLAACVAKAPANRPARLADLLARLTELYQTRFAQPPPARPAPGMFTAGDYNNRGVTYAALQQYQRALVDYEQAIQLDPSRTKAYLGRGATYHALQNYEQALADYERAIALDPNYALIYVNRALIYHDLHQYEQALADQQRALALDRDDAQAYGSRGNTYYVLRQYEQALADYEQAIALDPDLAEAYANRGNTYYVLRQYEQALADYEQAIALDPNLAQAYVGRGRTHMAMQKYERALADYERAIVLDPNVALVYNNRGDTYYALQQYERALADYRQALSFDPNDAKAYVNIGAILGNQGRHEEALTYFEQAAQLGDQNGAEYATKTRQWLERKRA